MTFGGQGGAIPMNEKEAKQYSIASEYIATFKSLKEAGRANDIDPRHISDCCLQKANTSKGYQWCFVGNEHLIQSYPKTTGGYSKIPVNQYDLQGNYIRTFNSIAEAADSLKHGTQKQIAICCRTEDGSSGGYQWRFAKLGKSNIALYRRKLNKNGKCLEPTVEVAVEQYSLEGEYITTYKNARIAADAIGLSKGGNSAILRAYQGKQKKQVAALNGSMLIKANILKIIIERK